MGFPNSDHIIKHILNKTIESVTQEEILHGFVLHFTNGESIRFYPHDGKIISTPFDKNGIVKQSTIIMKEQQNDK